MTIIEELDKEHINLQETIRNLRNQDYGFVYDMYLTAIINQAIFKTSMEVMEEMTNEMNNPTAEELLK